MAEHVDERKILCPHQESVDSANGEPVSCMHCGKLIEHTKEIFHHAAEKGKQIAHNLSSRVTEEDIKEAEEDLRELEQEEAHHLAKETALYEGKFRATTPDSIDDLHEEQMDEHEVRRDIFKRKEKAVERLAYLRKKRAEQQLEEIEKNE